MSFLEISLLVTATIIPFYISSSRASYKKQLWLFISLFIILHIIVDGFRWQMFPIYLVNIILIFCSVKRYTFFKGGWFRKIISSIALLLMVGIGFACSSILPVFNLPSPDGPFAVGSQYMHINSNQDETITKEKNDKRALILKVWYPAILNNEPKEVFLNEGDRQGFATKYGLPKSTFNYLNKIETHTYSSPSISDQRFPTLIFSHGYYSKASGYYSLIENIVSHGFIVININHTYESVGSLFPDGNIKLYDRDFDKKNNNQAMAEMVWNAMENYKKASNKMEQRAAIENTLKNYVAADINERWTNDINIVLNKILNLEEDYFLENHIDTSKIGVLGHSQGGAAAAQALLEIPQIKTGINIDGTQWGNMIDTILAKPFLLLSSDWPATHPNFNDIAYHNGSRSAFYKAKILNSGHSSFMDIPYMINLSLINEAGTIDKERASTISAKLIVDFFNKYLNEEKVQLLKLSNQFPELEIEMHEKSNRK